MKIGATNVGFNLGGGIVTLSGGTALFVQQAGGIAGTVSGDIHINIPGTGTGAVEFDGTFRLALNSSPKAVSQQFVIAGQTLTLSLPGGPYLRVEGIGVSLKMAGQSLSGDFVFENSTVNGVTVYADRGRNLSAAFGDGTTQYVTLSSGTGFFR